MAAVLDEGSWLACEGGLLEVGYDVDPIVVRCQDCFLGRDAFQRRKGQFSSRFAGFNLAGLQRDFLCCLVLRFVFRPWQLLI